MNRSLLAVCALAMAACAGIPEDDFIVGYESTYCETYAACATPEMLRAVNQQECLRWYAAAEYPEAPTYRYDGVFADSCLADFREAGCNGSDPEIPSSCDAVYGGAPPPQLPAREYDPTNPL